MKSFINVYRHGFAEAAWPTLDDAADFVAGNAEWLCIIAADRIVFHADGSLELTRARVVDPSEFAHKLKVAAASPVAAVRGGAGSAPGTTTSSPSILNAGSADGVAPDQSTGTHGNFSRSRPRWWCVQVAAGSDGAPAPVPPPVRAPISQCGMVVGNLVCMEPPGHTDLHGCVADGFHYTWGEQ